MGLHTEHIDAAEQFRVKHPHMNRMPAWPLFQKEHAEVLDTDKNFADDIAIVYAPGRFRADKPIQKTMIEECNVPPGRWEMTALRAQARNRIAHQRAEEIAEQARRAAFGTPQGRTRNGASPAGSASSGPAGSRPKKFVLSARKKRS